MLDTLTRYVARLTPPGWHDHRPGQVRVAVRDADGDVRRRDLGANLIKQGYMEELVLQNSKDATTTNVSGTHFAVGTGDALTGGVGAGDLLETEVYRTTTDSSSQATDGLSVDITGTFTDSDVNGQVINEAGLVDDTDAVPINRIRLDGLNGRPLPIDLDSGEEATLTFTVGFEQEADL